MAVFAHSITIFLWVACSRKWTKVEVSLMAKIEMVKILYIYIRIYVFPPIFYYIVVIEIKQVEEQK